MLSNMHDLDFFPHQVFIYFPDLLFCVDFSNYPPPKKKNPGGGTAFVGKQNLSFQFSENTALYNS